MNSCDNKLIQKAQEKGYVATPKSQKKVKVVQSTPTVKQATALQKLEKKEKDKESQLEKLVYDLLPEPEKMKWRHYQHQILVTDKILISNRYLGDGYVIVLLEDTYDNLLKKENEDNKRRAEEQKERYENAKATDPEFDEDDWYLTDAKEKEYLLDYRSKHTHSVEHNSELWKKLDEFDKISQKRKRIEDLEEITNEIIKKHGVVENG